MCHNEWKSFWKEWMIALKHNIVLHDIIPEYMILSSCLYCEWAYLPIFMSAFNLQQPIYTRKACESNGMLTQRMGWMNHLELVWDPQYPGSLQKSPLTVHYLWTISLQASDLNGTIRIYIYIVLVYCSKQFGNQQLRRLMILGAAITRTRHCQDWMLGRRRKTFGSNTVLESFGTICKTVNY